MSLHTAIIRAVAKGTAKWAKQRKAEARHAAAMLHRRERLVRYHRITIKEVAWEVMEKAYMAASDNGRLPATATQVMYAARGEIQQRTGRQLDRQYFNQTLLPEYLAEHDVSSCSTTADTSPNPTPKHRLASAPLRSATTSPRSANRNGSSRR